MKDYIRELRGLVGHRPLVMAGAAVLILDADDRVLLVRRSDDLKWGLPGGLTELGESVEDTARREVHNVTVVFSSRKWQGVPSPADGESVETRFFARSEVPEDISGPDRPIVRQYVEAAGRRFSTLDGDPLSSSSSASSNGREYPAHPLVGVAAVVIDKSRRILLVKRGKEPAKGLWSVPGGMVKAGETMRQAVRRETLEETGLLVTPAEIATVAESIIPDGEGRTRFHYVLVDFFAKPVGGPGDGLLEPGDDADDVRWMDAARALEMELTAGVRELVQQLMNRRIL